MKPRLALDGDSTIWHMLQTWDEIYESHEDEHEHAWEHDEGSPFSLADAPDWDYPTRVCRECFHEALHSVAGSLRHEPYPGAVDAILAISTMCDLYLISSCPPELLTSKWDWLEAHGLGGAFADVIITHDKLGAMRQHQIPLIVDDKPGLASLLAPHGIDVIRYWQPYNDADGSVPVVHNWSEVLREVLAYYGAATIPRSGLSGLGVTASDSSARLATMLEKLA